jgi:fructokinase
MTMEVQTPHPVVVGIGEILWDLLPDGKILGGAPANFAHHAGQLSADARIVSAVGQDPLGEEIVRSLGTLGVRTSHVATNSGHPTGTVDVRLDARGVPEYIIHQDVAWDFIPVTDDLLDLALRADIVCFGSLGQRSPVSRNTIRRFLEATRPNCLRIFDINLRQSYYTREIIEESLLKSTVLKLNEHELPVVANLFGLSGGEGELLQMIRERYDLKLVAYTEGERGSRLVTADGVSTRPGTAVKVVDTVGAGDAFTAALAVGLLQGLPIERIHAWSDRLAAFVCTCKGATPHVPRQYCAEP